MNPLSIQGIGVLTSRGRGLEKFEKSFREGWIAPSLSAEGLPAYRIAAEDLTDREVLKEARRADRFSKMTVLAAFDAVRDSGETLENIRESTGMIVATALGSHSTIFKFLDGVIDYGEGNVSPTTFAHSIHNSAASYVAGALGCKGPTMTVTSFHFSFQQALLLAYSWLSEGRVNKVLVGISEECSTAMEYICAEKLAPAPGGKTNPLNCSARPKVVLGEASVFFLLTLDPAKKKYGSFSEIKITKDFNGWEDADLSILSAHGMAGSEEIYKKTAKKGLPTAAYANIYGSVMSAGALESAAAALMLKNQIRYASPVLNYSGPFEMDEISAAAPLRTVQCISHNCEGSLAFVKVVS